MAKWSKLDTERISSRVAKARDDTLLDGVEYLLETANRTIPIEEATLQRSGRATAERGEAAVSYDTPYAVPQHERTDYRHDPGRRAKWLEMTVREQGPAIRELLAEGLRRRLR